MAFRHGIIATLLLLLSTSTALAQTPFTLQGIGQNVETGTARDTGRGGWGLADRDTLAPSTLNPAALADLRYSQLTFSGEGLRTIDRGPGQDRLTWRVTVPNVRLAVPLRDGQLALHAGFNVKRSFSYESYSLFEVDRFGRTINGQELYRRDGNLFEIPVGLAWRPLPRVALGAAVLLVRGPVEDLVTQTFTGGPLANSYSERLELEGLATNLSLLLDAPGPLSIGASVTPAYDLDVERTTSLEAVSGEAVSNETITMPTEYKAGLMLELGKHWRFGADGIYQAFGDIGPQSVWTPTPRDEWSVAAGFERRLHRSGRGRDWTAPLRFGFMWRRWGYQVGGSPVEERVVSVGTGVPFRNWLGTIDMSLSYAWIGSIEDNGYESEALRLGVSISGLERLIF
jgi:hypothetical protein